MTSGRAPGSTGAEKGVPGERSIFILFGSQDLSQKDHNQFSLAQSALILHINY